MEAALRVVCLSNPKQICRIARDQDSRADLFRFFAPGVGLNPGRFHRSPRTDPQGIATKALLVQHSPRDMKLKEIFGFLIRLLGLLFLYRAADMVPMSWRLFWTLFDRFNFRILMECLFSVTWPLVVAVWMLFGAPPIMRWAYPPEETPRT
jgi:hypothetical protein